MHLKSVALTTEEIRHIVRQRRRDLVISERLHAEQSIYRQIYQHPKLLSAKKIAIFLSFDGEVNTQPIIEYLWQQNKSVYLPIIDLTNPQHLAFLPYHRHSQLTTNKFGIAEPIYDVDKILPYQSLDIVFTPLVAFDHRNYRIGMGGGFYDRLLQNYQHDNIYPIGLAFKCQQIEYIANQSWDIQLPEIIIG